MPTTAITDAVVFPQDPGTSPSGTIGFATDPPSGASFALHAAYQSGAGNYVLNGENGSLGFTVDSATDELTIDPGVCYITQDATGTSVQSQTGTTYDVPLPGTVSIVYAVIVPTAVTVALDTDSENTVYLSVDPDTRNSATAHAGAGLGTPADPAIELGTVDSAAGTTVERVNDRPDGVYDVIDANAVSAESATVTDAPTNNTDVVRKTEIDDKLDSADYNPEADTHSQTTSGDITVTDTQVGTVSDGEFLTNSGGSLTGGTVEAEPNVPDWEEVSGSPFTTTNVDFTIDNIDTYDTYLVFVDANLSYDSDVKINVNGQSANYDVTFLDGSQSVASTDPKVAYRLSTVFSFIMSGRWGESWVLSLLHGGYDPNQPAAIKNSSVSSPLNQISFFEGEGYTVEIYGRDT